MFYSIGDGTGLGLGTLVRDRLNVGYGRKLIYSFTIFPSKRFSTSPVEPYNAVLALNGMVEFQEAASAVENNSLYKICSDHLGIESPTYSDIYR